MLEAAGIIWDLRQVPPELLDESLLEQDRIAIVAEPRAISAASSSSIADSRRDTEGGRRIIAQLPELPPHGTPAAVTEPEPSP